VDDLVKVKHLIKLDLSESSPEFERKIANGLLTLFSSALNDLNALLDQQKLTRADLEKVKTALEKIKDGERTAPQVIRWAGEYRTYIEGLKNKELLTKCNALAEQMDKILANVEGLISLSARAQGEKTL
jgi:hypothetical protein